MKQVKSFIKEYYIEECKNDGGVPILYANMQKAVKALCEYSRTRKYDDFELSEEKAEEGIKRSSNGDWILMDDESVLWRSYPKIEEELAKSGNVKLWDCRKKAAFHKRNWRKRLESVFGSTRITNGCARH